MIAADTKKEIRRQISEMRADLKYIYTYVKRCKLCKKQYGADNTYETYNNICPTCVLGHCITKRAVQNKLNKLK